jgi:NTE family protein
MKKILFFFLFFLSLFLQGQEKEDVKVGLVLSGGGAKGLAHIGALKMIEEAGLQIDYIAGTSMGAIVGALYSAGYSAHQLDSIFHEINFNILIQDDIPRSAKTFYEKSETEKYALTLPFDNFQISFPSGLSRGQNIYNLVSKLTMHLGDIRDFSEMPIPFLCIASNIETGEQVILESGSLPKAVSASGAIPSLFSPVMIDGMLLTDGGVTNNYPVQELRDRGADIIIGVDVQDTLMDREELKSAVNILNQIGNFRTIREMKDKIALTDVYIKPDIKEFNVLSFEKGEEIIKAGEVAAGLKIDELKAIAQGQNRVPKPHVTISPVDTVNISALSIEGNTSYPRSYIMGKLKLRYGNRYTFQDLHYGINNLAATGNFRRINYSLSPNDSTYTLGLQLEESPNKTFLRLALHYDDLYKSGALINLTRKSLLFTNDVTSFDVILGDNFRYNFQYYIDKGYYWSVGLKSRYNAFHKGIDFNITSGNGFVAQDISINKVELDYQDYTNQLYVETLFRQIISFGVGVEHKHLKITSETFGNTGEEIFAPAIFENSNIYSAFGYLKVDSLDDKFFPRKGWYFDGNFHLYLFSSDYNRDFSQFSISRGNLGYVFTPFRNFTTRVSSEAGFRVGPSGTNSLDFFLGGYGNNLINNLIPFYGYDFLSLTGDSYIKGLIELDYEIFRRNHIIASANFANVENDLYSTGIWLSLPTYSGYAIGYGRETFLGPVEVKYSWSPELRSSQWFFSLGFWF